MALVMVRTVVGMGCFSLTGYGAYMILASGLELNGFLPVAFCVVPMASLPLFLYGRRHPRRATPLHWVLAAAYLAVYALLDWRTCSERQICGSALATVLDALTTLPVGAAFLVALLHPIVDWLGRAARKG